MPAMLSSSSLQPPKTGTSRWSKALPEVPGIDFDDIYDEYDDELSPVTSQAKNLPKLPFVPPPPRLTSMANAQPLLPSSLPPLHLLNTSVAPLSGPPKMAIPRRPVGKQPPQLPQQHQQSHPEPHSPAQSINSILSAYSQSSGESLIRSSDAATNSTRQSETNTSPGHQAPPASTKTQTLISPSSTKPSTTRLPQTQQQQQQQQHGAPNPPFESNRPPPPPPSKDSKFGLPKSPAPNRAPAQGVDTSSPPQPQLWRRRSTKAERNLELPDLKLITSHGSTAATHSAVQQPVQPVVQPVAVAQPLAQSAIQPVAQPYLPPGAVQASTPAYQQPRSNQPQVAPAAAVAAPEQAAETETQTMGSGGSKLTRLKDKLHTLHRRGKSSSDTTSDSTGRPGAQRPPTPEYQKQDIKTPIVDSFISPLSPASSPEPVADVSPQLAKELPSPSQVPIQQEPPQESIRVLSPNVSPVESKPVARKALPPLNQYLNETKPRPTPKEAPEPTALPQTNNQVKPLPEQKLQAVAEPRPESPATDSLPPLITEEVRFPSYGIDSPTSRAPSSAEVPTKFPPRGSSVRSNAPRPFEQFRQPAAELDPRLVSSESQGFLYKGRDGTLYPEMKVTREPDPEAAYFPRQADSLLSGGEVFKAPTLKDSHYSCYQGHRTMNRRNVQISARQLALPNSDINKTTPNKGRHVLFSPALPVSPEARRHSHNHIDLGRPHRPEARHRAPPQLPESPPRQAIDSERHRGYGFDEDAEERLDALERPRSLDVRQAARDLQGAAQEGGQSLSAVDYDYQTAPGGEADLLRWTLRADETNHFALHTRKVSGHEKPTAASAASAAAAPTQAQPRLRPAFSTLQQHYSPAKSAAPKPLTSTFLAPPSPSKLPANVAASAETSRLQAELLQLHLLHQDAAVVDAEWRSSARQKLGARFAQVSADGTQVDEREKAEIERENVLALRSWAVGGGLEDRIQTLDAVINGVWTLGEPGGRYARVIRRFERWVDRMCEIEDVRRGDGALLQEQDVLFISELDAAWKDECMGLIRRLDGMKRQLQELGQLPDEANEERSSLRRMMENSRTLIEGMLAELSLMEDIEREALAREDDWIEKMNRDEDADDTPRAGAVWRVV
ncbi:hypothetical protein QQZ08_009314 [Neonectria magnoliae]|uniref:Uncharacterized protein n=1 Tax=Neonectria magnoliae TaxID=2732573 RepID=A0ABR1HNR9_9HYPO